MTTPSETERGRTIIHGLVQQLRDIRRARRISQAAIGTFLGIKRSTMSDWETRCHLPAASTLALYAEFVGWKLAVIPAEQETSHILPVINEDGDPLWLHTPCGVTLWFHRSARPGHTQPRHCYACRQDFPIATWTQLYRVVAHR